IGRLCNPITRSPNHQITRLERGANGDRDVQDLAGRRADRRVSRLPDRGVRGDGRARRGAPDSGAAGRRSRGAVELQGGEVRIVLGGSERAATSDVHDAPEPAESERAGDDWAEAQLPA